jgi:hypothetical protein
MNPYQPPTEPFAAGPATAAGSDLARLRAVAQSHRLINLAILAQFGILFLLIGGSVAMGHAFAAIMAILGVVLFLVGLASLAAAAWLAFSLGGILAAIGCVLLMMVPMLNFVMLIVMSRIATARLRKAGYRVGLLGADPEAIPRVAI